MDDLMELYEAYSLAEREGEIHTDGTCCLCGDAITDEDSSDSYCNVCLPIISGVTD